jgi:hypothetical protein
VQTITAADIVALKTSELHPRTLIQVVSRSSPSDVRLTLDTAASDYDPERVGLVRGSVTVDTSRDVLRSLSIDLIDWEGDWRPGPNRYLWPDAYVRVYTGYKETAMWPQGVYVPQAPKIGEGKTVSFQGLDKASTVNGQPEGGFSLITTIGKGVNVKDALASLAGGSGETDLNFQSTASVIPYDMTWSLSDSEWAASRKIAAIPGNYRPLHFDEVGRRTWIQDPDPNQLSPSWLVWNEPGRPGSALTDEYASWISASLEIDTDGLVNWVGVKGGSAQNGLYSSVVQDSDPNSPTSVSRINRRPFWWNNGNPDPIIASQTDADNRAAYELLQRKRWKERVSMSMTALPPLQPWDVLWFRNPEMGIDDNYQVISYTLPLDTSGQMNVTGWKVRG